MSALTFFLLHVAIYAAIPLYFASLDSPRRAISFHAYLAVTLTLASLFGSVYSLPVAQGIDISGGALLFGAFMMGNILFVASESNLAVVKSVIRLVIMVNMMIYAIYFLAFHALQSSVFNTLDINPAAFSASLWVATIGGALTITELLLLLAALEFIKPKVQSVSAMAVMYTAAYIVIMCLDGVLFPSFFFGANPELLQEITGNMTSKLVVASAFGLPIFLYLSFFPDVLKRYMASPLHLRGLLPFADNSLREKIKQHNLLELPETQLRELAKRHALSAEAAGLGFWAIDTENGFDNALEMDQLCHEIYDSSEEEIANSLANWLQLVHPDDQDKLINVMTFNDELEWPLNITFRVVCKDGSLRHIESHARREASPTGSLRLLGVLRDVTANVQLQNQHSQLQEQLHRSQKMESVGQFAGGIAHDFNNLLTPIIGFADLNRAADADRDSMRRDIEEIWKAGRSAQELTHKLLAFGSHQVLKPVPVDLNRIVLDLDAILSRLVSENTQRNYELCDGQAVIEADRGQVEQVLLNLVANACDAMPEGGILTVRTHKTYPEKTIGSNVTQTGAQVVLSVIDNGIGMDSTVLEQIFEPFYTTKDRDKGTGLGLATSFGIVQQHQGTIHAESKLGAGTTVTVTFPASSDLPELPSETPRKNEVLSAHNMEQKNILVVEDDAAVRRIIVRVLTDQGYNVTTEENPINALKRDNRDIDLVVTDLIMPEMSGIELIERLRATLPDIRVLMISGYLDDMKLQPHERFLQKPFSATDLVTNVRAALAHKPTGADTAPVRAAI